MPQSRETTMRSGPLTDLRVIEMGQLLADFGVWVIKIEPSVTGDPMREWGGRSRTESRSAAGYRAQQEVGRNANRRVRN